MYLYATDYDRTLNCRGITPELKEALARWRSSGNLFGVVSGRKYSSIRGQMDEDGLEVDFLIANNGAILADGNDQILEVTTIPTQTAIQLIYCLNNEYIRSLRIDAVRFSRQWKKVPEIVCKNGLLSAEEDVWPEITEITASYPTAELTHHVKKEIETRLGNAVCPLLPGSTSIDCVSVSVNKAVGIKRIIRLLGTVPEKILTTGDSHNDLAMLTDPDFEGYAVENADETIKQTVGRTVPDPVHLLQKYL